MKKVIILGSFLVLSLIIGSTYTDAACRVHNGRIEVSPRGACSSIQEAINVAPGTADQPVLIDVLPGTYVERTIGLAKSYIHLKGAGSDVTTIHNAVDNVTIHMNAYGLTNIEISGFTISNAIGWAALNVAADVSNLSIHDNKITGKACLQLASLSGGTGTITVSNNTITNCNRITFGVTGISSIKILNNEISNNAGGGVGLNGVQSAIIKDNIISANVGGGIGMDNSSGSISGNMLTNNTTDIGLSSGTNVNISFNRFDSLQVSDAAWIGNFNVKSDGTPW